MSRSASYNSLRARGATESAQDPNAWIRNPDMVYKVQTELKKIPGVHLGTGGENRDGRDGVYAELTQHALSQISDAERTALYQRVGILPPAAQPVQPPPSEPDLFTRITSAFRSSPITTTPAAAAAPPIDWANPVTWQKKDVISGVRAQLHLPPNGGVYDTATQSALNALSPTDRGNVYKAVETGIATPEGHASPATLRGLQSAVAASPIVTTPPINWANINWTDNETIVASMQRSMMKISHEQNLGFKIPVTGEYDERTRAGLNSLTAAELQRVRMEAQQAVNAASVSTANNSTPGGQGLSPRTAVFDAARGILILPDGSTLNAGSGNGAGFNNTNMSNVTMKGCIPPGLWHVGQPAGHTFEIHDGSASTVQAMYLTPARGTDSEGRAGLFIHPSFTHNQSTNGCVAVDPSNIDFITQARKDGLFTDLLVVDDAKKLNLPGPMASAVVSHEAKHTLAQNRIGQRPRGASPPVG